MNRLAFYLALPLLLLSSAFAKEPPPFAINFHELPVSQVVLWQYDTCVKRPLVIDPKTLATEAKITLKAPDMTCAGLDKLMADVLNVHRLSLRKMAAVDVLSMLDEDDRLGWSDFLYRPRHRDPLELAESAAVFVRRGSFSHNARKGVAMASTVPPQVPSTGANGASVSARTIDRLFFTGPAAEVHQVRDLIERLDTPQPQVEIVAAIYEVSNSGSRGSALSLALDTLNGRLSMSLPTGSIVGSSVKLKSSSLSAVLSVLDTDTRFKYVARPQVLVKDGEPVRFFAGQDQRVAGSVLLDRNGNPIQSKETLSAGLTIEATPRIRQDSIDLMLSQVISNFATSGTDPSILKRELKSRLVMEPSAVYLVGGLKSQRSTVGRDGAFGFTFGTSVNDDDSEIFLLLSVRPVSAASEL